MRRRVEKRWNVAILVAVLAVAAWLTRDWRTPDERLTECKTNLKNIGTALEMYSTDWSGKYPASLVKLTPNYLKTIPVCPTTHTDTYTGGASFGSGAPLNTQGYQDYYYLCCRGANHADAGLALDLPAYNALPGCCLERAPDRSW